MSCYFRHMKDVLDELGIEVTEENKKEIDRLLHGLAEVGYKNCSPAWQAIKAQIKGGEASREAFLARLRAALQSR
ncbi:MAG: hypothetical protein P1P84_18610 [Deferrisomatales bacterium]|nr:hypothetical protein [Deferrisomatales bacterium]